MLGLKANYPVKKFVAIAVLLGTLIPGIVRIIIAIRRGDSIGEAVGMAITGLCLALLVYVLLVRPRFLTWLSRRLSR